MDHFQYGIFDVIFSAFGLLLNILVAIAIGRDKSMKSTTYFFMIQLALTDAEALAGMLMGPGALLIAGNRDPSYILNKISTFIYACGFHLSTVMMVLVAFTRWAHFSQVSKLNAFFSHRNCVLITIFIWIGFHLFYSPFVYFDNLFVPVSDDSAAYSYTSFTFSLVYRYFDEVLNDSSAILQIFFNALSLYKVMKQRKQINTPELRAANWREVKLLIQCIIDSSFYVAFVVALYYSIYARSNETWLGILTEVLLLINHVDCALLYLCLNKKLRSILLNGMKRMKNGIFTRSATVERIQA